MAEGIRELARRANVGGDIELQQFREKQRLEAEGALSKFADATKAKTTGKYQGEDVVETAKFLSSFLSFFPPTAALAAPINLALTGLDATLDQTSSKKKEKELKSLKDKLISQYEGSTSAEYLSGNIGELSSQAKQALSGQRKADLISTGLDVGMEFLKIPGVKDKIKNSKFLTMLIEKIPFKELGDTKLTKIASELFKKGGDKAIGKASEEVLDKGIEELVGTGLDKGTEELLETGAEKGAFKKILDTLGLGPEAGTAPSPLNLIDETGVTDEFGEIIPMRKQQAPYPFFKDPTYVPITDASKRGGEVSLKDNLANMITGMEVKLPSVKMPEFDISTEKGPDLHDLYSYLQPRVMSSMRSDIEPTIPGAPRRTGPSIRRRIR